MPRVDAERAPECDGAVLVRRCLLSVRFLGCLEPRGGGGPSPPSPSPSPPSPPSPPGGEYGAPPCPSDESPVQISGVSGDFCAPSCSSSQPCPDAPAGAQAQAQCAINQNGSKTPTLCALICKPQASGQCPRGASCQAIQGSGICTFPSAVAHSMLASFDVATAVL
jgi:hypothetical protein